MSSTHSRPLAASALGAFAIALLAACSGGSDPVQPEPVPAQLSVVAGVGAPTAVVGTAVPTVPTVRVLSDGGQPMSGVTVLFTVTGGGTVGTPSAQTNAQGIASPGSWTLGTTVGENVLTATVASLTPVRFTVTTVAGPVAELRLVSGGGQPGTVGQPLPNPIVVRALDAHGNAVAGAVVDFTPASGSAAPAQASTGADGQAQTAWTLGAAEGAQTLRASAGTVGVDVTAQAAPAPSTTLRAAQVEAGAYATCARSAAGQLSCWGANSAALVGDGTTTFREFPVPVALAGVAFADVSVGSTNTCALTTTGAAYCWGTGPAIGDGSVGVPRTSPVAVTGGHVFTKIVVGTTAACALKGDGTAWCWGNTMPLENTTARVEPTLVSSTLRFTDIASGARPTNGAIDDYSCGISTAGPTYCWGITGIGANPQPVQPTALGGGVAFTSLSIGRNHACGLTADGRAYCWGDNQYGQLGNGTTGTVRATPVAVSGTTRFTAIAAGGAHSCGLTADGALYCWGNNSPPGFLGALGIGVIGDGSSTTTPVPMPRAVAAPAGVQFASLSVGLTHACAVATTTEVYCWGTRATSSPSITIGDLAPVLVSTR